MFAIYQILLGRKTCTRQSLRHRQTPQPKVDPTQGKLRFKVSGHFFPQQTFFRGLGLISYSKQTATNPTQPNYPLNKYPNVIPAFTFIFKPRYGAPTVVGSTKVPGEVVALTHHRGLQFSWLYKYLGQGESPPRFGYVEMRENEYEWASKGLLVYSVSGY